MSLGGDGFGASSRQSRSGDERRARMSSTGPGGTGSSTWEKVGTVAQVAAVFVAAAAAVVACTAASKAETTAEHLQGIEDERHDDEQLEDLVAAQITRYFSSSSCEERAQMLASTLDRFYDLPNDEETEGVPRAEVRADCEDAKANDQEYVLHEIEVIGTPDSKHAFALAKLGSYNTPQGHYLVETTSVEILMRVERGWEDDKDPIFPITSMAETIEPA
jgi:hypothetical protein